MRSLSCCISCCSCSSLTFRENFLRLYCHATRETKPLNARVAFKRNHQACQKGGPMIISMDLMFLGFSVNTSPAYNWKKYLPGWSTYLAFRISPFCIQVFSTLDILYWYWYCSGFRFPRAVNSKYKLLLV